MLVAKVYKKGYLCADLEGVILSCSDTMADWFQRSSEQIIGTNIKEHVEADCYRTWESLLSMSGAQRAASGDVSTAAPSQSVLFEKGSLRVSFTFLRQGQYNRHVLAVFEHNKADAQQAASLTQAKDPFLATVNGHSTSSQDQDTLRTDLIQADIASEFKIQYQPQVDLETSKIVGMEALLRWQHPKLGLISPAAFIPLAEETGKIIPISKWVLEQACRQNISFQSMGYPAIRVAVNVSVIFFQHPSFVESIKQTLELTGLKPQYLELELTESFLIHNFHQATCKLKELKEIGVRIALDDFGKGYSSLYYLKHLCVDTLKIDRDFIKEINESAYDRYISSTIISLAHNFKMSVVAEGVETEEQLAFLKEQSCNGMQGYLFSRPIDPEEFSKLLN